MILLTCTCGNEARVLPNEIKQKTVWYSQFLLSSTVEPRYDERQGKIVRYNEVSLYRGSFPYTLLLLR